MRCAAATFLAPRRFFLVLRVGCEGQAFLGEAEVVSGAEALPHSCALEARLSRLQQGELGDVGRQRELLEQQLEQEREAIRRATERLKQLQGENPQ